MTLPLTGEDLTRYNNLPAIPPTKPLGDLVNSISAGGGSIDLALLSELTSASSVATRYFGSTGNDTTGDGSQTSPYRDMQRCIDSIPPGCQGRVNFLALDAGPFDGVGVPDLLAGRDSLHVTFVGAGASVLTFATLPAGTHDANAAGGSKVGRFRHAAVGAHGALSAGSHWLKVIYDAGGGNRRYRGLIVDHLNSASPDLSIVSEFDRSTWGYLGFELVPFTSVLSNISGALYLRTVPQTNRATITLVGFTTTNYLYVEGSAIYLSAVAQTDATKVINILSDISNESFEQHALFCASACFLRGPLGVGIGVSGIFNKTLDIAGLSIHLNGACRAVAADGYSVRVGHFGPMSLHGGGGLMPNVDFEGNATANIYARRAEIRLYDDGSQPTTDGQATNFLVAEHASQILARDDAAACVMGSTTGVCVSLATHSHSRGLLGHGTTPALRNTTTPGNDISVGADATPRAFSTLPRTDVGEAIPHFVRAG